MQRANREGKCEVIIVRIEQRHCVGITFFGWATTPGVLLTVAYYRTDGT